MTTSDANAWRALPLVERELLDAPAEVVAPRLLGTLLVSDEVVGRVVEVEAYGPDDPASHSVRGRRPGNATMFAGPGHLYCYVSYGVHHLGNVVVGPAGTGAAVLLRSIEVLAGRDVAAARRGDPTRINERRATARWLGGGPGRLGQVLALDRTRDDGIDLLDRASRVVLCTDGKDIGAENGAENGAGNVADGTRNGPRVGVTDAPDVLWRWWLDGHPAVSRYVRSPRAVPAS